MTGVVKLILWFVVLTLLGAGLIIWLNPLSGVNTRVRDQRLIEWFRTQNRREDWMMKAKSRCGQAPFVFPSDGYIGYLWDDSFRPGHRHQGIDIFGGASLGTTSVYAAASGYLTRQADWKSSVIIRIPDDPLQPGRQIWTYYTHMAAPNGNSYISTDFPPACKRCLLNRAPCSATREIFLATPRRRPAFTYISQ